MIGESQFEPTVWGPHYWFFIHSVAHSYPDHPNSTTKRKYYDFIQNLPLFLPNGEMGNNFSKLLDVYPVSPYLDSRESFIRWTHFIHNKINLYLGKQEVSLVEAIQLYKNQYKPKPVFLYETFKMRRQLFHLAFIILLLVLIFLYLR
jgi:FAD-linked sulfhydryl oxidase